MTTVAASTPATPAASKKKEKTSKPKTKPTHPETKTMVIAAIKGLKDRKGASLQAIKKYIAANNKVDIVKLNAHLKRCLKKGVENKVFEQVKGSGASGRFRLAEKGDKAAPSKPAVKKTAKPKTTPKKVKTPKKAATKKSPKKTAAKPKPKKATKAKKPAAKKPTKKAAAKKA